MYATGGGATKYGEAFTQKSGIKLVRSDELKVIFCFVFDWRIIILIFGFLGFGFWREIFA